jgi:hypothetical protein
MDEEEGTREADTCNRNGCKGIMVPADDGPEDMYILVYTECGIEIDGEY